MSDRPTSSLPVTSLPPEPRLFGQLYRLLLFFLAALLLGFFLACTVTGVIALCFYENLSGLGLMTLGVILFAAGRLALDEAAALNRPC